MNKRKRNIFYIYKIICLSTNKYYIGKHCAFSLENDYFGSGKIIKNSIVKYGKENHIKEILVICNNKNELSDIEKEIVNEELLTDPLCMNIKIGGKGGWLKQPFDVCSKAGKIGGKVLSNKLKTDPEFRKMISEKLRKTSLKAVKDGRIKGWDNTKIWLGKKHSNEHNEKTRLSSLDRCWINNTYSEKCIKKKELNKYLELDWKKGRKINKEMETE